MWPHLSQEEENRRWHFAEELQGNQNEELNDDATSVLCFRELRKYGVEDLYIYARDPNYPYAGGSSWLSWKLCEMNDIAPDGSWLEGEASELRTERPRFETLIDSGTLKLWEIMAANPACPGDLIDRMVRVPEQDNDHEQVRFCAAHNPSTPPETLTWLIDRDYTPDEDSESEDDDPCTEVREVALRNPATPLESLLRWSTFKGLGMWHLDHGRSERSAVAANWALPVDVMERLSVDAVDNVRAAIAGNPCCPVTLLEQLSLDSDERGFVRRAIRSNPSSSDLARERADSPRDSGLSVGDGGSDG